MEPERLRDRLASIPHDPGVYQFLEGETVLYIGKAVDLRDRLASYVDPTGHRMQAMLDRADDIDIAVTDTETQALLLEANLIKRHQPRYNVRLKDDKSYPMVQLTDHAVPRIEVTRDPEPGATVYGPYTDRRRLDAVVKAIREAYGLRGCSDYKFANRERPCLDYELGICAGPCTGEITVEAYEEAVTEVERFFEGEIGTLYEPVQTAMEDAASAHNFERAANLRDRLRAIEQVHGRGDTAIATVDDHHTLDVIGVALRGDAANIARLHSESGKLVERTNRTMTAPHRPADGVQAVISAFITQYYAERPLPDELLIQEIPDDEELTHWLEEEGVSLVVPRSGRESTLLDLALKNANRSWDRPGDAHAVLAERFGIDKPRRIEGIDVSHAQGRAVVGSNVVFVDGDPETAHYRRKKLEEGNDDVDRIAALARWRAQRAVDGRDSRPDPELFLVDGGTAQLNAVLKVFDTIGWDIPVIALAKREETVITHEGPQQWPDDDPALHLLQQIRDEAHRFAVSYHQQVRDSIETVLDDIDGIGPHRRQRLLRRFGSLEGIRSATREELLTVEGIGESTVDTLLARL